MELYKLYRPTKMKEIAGNLAVLKSLSNMVKAKTLPQVILFTGPSGCGKTTIARILQNNLGCADMDKQELNSSSFRGIDSIRELQSASHLCAIGDSRVWILDEVQKWTSDAQSAALKLLEDTPRGVYFFLCTTNPEKLSKALRSRCTIIEVKSLTDREMNQVIDRVADGEQVTVSKEGRDTIIDASEGSARVALVLLDRLRSIPEDQWAEAVNGTDASDPQAIDLCRALSKGLRWNAVAAIIKTISVDPESARRVILAYFNSVLLKMGTIRAYEIIQCFQTPFYDTGKAGLTASCWEALHPDG